MRKIAASDTFKFEPHNGYGDNDPDGSPLPFGYISIAPIPVPVFELDVPLQFDPNDLKALAIKMAAAPEALLLLKAAAHALRSYQHGNTSPDLAGSIADKCDALLQSIGEE